MNDTKLKPGRELDALVAAKFMGWKIFTDYDEWVKLHRAGKFAVYSNPHPGNDHGPFVSREIDMDEWDGEESYADAWCPSIDMVAAWEVVKKLNKDGFLVTVVGSHDGNLSACMIIQGMAAPYPARDIFLHLDGWDELHKEHPDLLKKPIRVQAETAPLAICEAAVEFSNSQ